MSVFVRRLRHANVAAALGMALCVGAWCTPTAMAQSRDDTKALEDPEFDKSLPPLDPLPLPPAPDTAVPPPAPVNPAVEQELATPLVPLASFNDTPPDAAIVTEADPAIRYRVIVIGLREVGLEGRFNDLSALRQKSNAASAAQISARADADVALILRVLRSEGYYAGLATAQVNTLPNAENMLTVTLTATPGPRYVFGTITLTGLPPIVEPLAKDALALRSGDPIVATEVESAEARVALRLPEQGFPFAAVGQRDVALDDSLHIGDYTLPVDAGPRAVYGRVRAEGDPVFTARHIELLRRWKTGARYDSRKVDDLRQALIATSLLTTVAIEPVRTGQRTATGDEVVDLSVKQVKGPWRQLALSAGYGTGEGVKVTGSWTHRNLFPPEGALTVAGVAGSLQQSVGVIFRQSNAGQRDRTLTIAADVSRERFDAYSADTISLTGSLARASTPIFQKRWTWSLGGEVLATRETPFDPVRSPRTKSTYFIAALPLQLGYDRSDDLLDPRRGFRITARVSPEGQQRTGGGFDGYARLLLEGSTYYPVNSRLVIAGRARVGSIQGIRRNDIAPSRRYYAGGGGSVRGFGYQQLGPKDATGAPVGGRTLTEFAIEARYRFGNFGIVPFFDAGRVGESSTPSLTGMRYGAGIGGRLYTNFGPMRVDIATPIDRQPGEPTIAVYLSIGQAF